MQKKLSILLVALFFGAVLMFMNSQGFLDDGKKTIKQTIAPVSLYFSTIGSGVTDFFSGVANIGELQSENASLRDSINALKAENTRLKELRAENESLRKDLGFVRDFRLNYVPADVVAYDPSNMRGLITINKGTNNGLKNGMTVVSEGFFIGRITKASENFSKVMLVTDPASVVPAEIQGTNITGLVRGRLGTGLIIEKIPQGEEVKTGDTIITSGLGGEIPRGIIVGRVGEMIKTENSLFISARVDPQARLSGVLRVLVITK